MSPDVAAISAELAALLAPPINAPRAVQMSDEVTRILNLPRRVLDLESDEVAALVSDMTEYFKSRNGEQELYAAQAVALQEFHDRRGAFVIMPVGEGKTLVTLLAARALGLKRPMLFVPAGLRDKTFAEMPEYLKHWDFDPGVLRIESYDMLSRVQHHRMIDDYQPDGLFFDEVDKLKDESTAVTRRVSRYMDEHYEIPVLALTATPLKRSLNDQAHIIFWALKNLAPVPRDYNSRQEWAAALDEKVSEMERLAPGALMRFASEEDKRTCDERTAARRGLARRMHDTPGFVNLTTTRVKAALKISEIVPTYSATTEHEFAEMKYWWKTPDGHPISDGVGMWRHCRELALGFYYKWDPRPPQEWLTARAEWCTLVRHILSHNNRKLDSELQVAQAIEAGHYDRFIFPDDGDGRPAPDTLQAWQDIRGTFEPITVPVWLDDGPLELCADWMRKHAGIVWVEHVAFGDRLSAMTGVPFYRQGGEDSNGVSILHAPHGQPMIASIASNSTGRNLQAWSKNLMTSCIPTGRLVEQNTGRTHRNGQKSPEVTYEILIGCLEQFSSWAQAVRDSKFISDMTGQRLKILYADSSMPEQGDIELRALDSERWAPPRRDED